MNKNYLNSCQTNQIVVSLYLIVESSPDWEAGKIDSMPVNVVFTFPVNFALDDK